MVRSSYSKPLLRVVARVAFASFLSSVCHTALGQSQPADSDTTHEEVQQLREMVVELQHRLDALQGVHTDLGAPATIANDAAALRNASEDLKSVAPMTVITKEDRSTLDFLNGTTINVGIDGYFEYNFNAPVGRVNLLRAYDVSSNSFSLNQASLVIEHAPNPAASKRFGTRLDLQYGQATETLQGGAQNELRPQVYRNIFQVYGTYVFPVGTGLTADFGKWASSLGVENNYAKDQINYSRSYLFNYLPFYHMGFRANYNFTPRVNVAYWLVNGAQQAEAFSGYKSQAIITTLKPTAAMSLNVNYFFGQQGREPIRNSIQGFQTVRPSQACRRPTCRPHQTGANTSSIHT